MDPQNLIADLVRAIGKGKARTRRSQLNVLVSIVEAGPNQRAHGAIYYYKIFVAIGLYARDRVHKRASIGDH